MSVIVDCRRPTLDDVLDQVDSIGPATAADVVEALVWEGFLYRTATGSSVTTQIADLHALELIEPTPAAPCVWSVTSQGRAMAVKIRGAR